MATINRFEDIEAWQHAERLEREIFKLTLEGEFAKDFSLKDQIRRSTGSVMDNIAEGFERNGNKELILFLSYAKGSIGEVRSQLHRARNRKYITEDVYEKLYEECLSISKMIMAFINYLNRSDIKGAKYKVQDVEIQR
ncbi:MAG: four helix bundle protein [Flavobacteriales bacterium]|nr:four helix bundle protein [Flavobacteriales bacterium]